MPTDARILDLANVIWARGRMLLVCGLASALAAVLLTAVLAPAWLWLFPVAGLGATAVVVLSRNPMLHLVTVLAGFVLVLDYTDGIQVHEAVFGAYYLSYLGAWFVVRLFRGERLIHDALDALVAGYLAFCTATLLLLPFFDADPLVALNQWRAVVTLGFYFPVREAVRAGPRALRLVLWTIGFIALVVLVRNVLIYVDALRSASALWQVLYGRHRINEMLIVLALYGSFTMLLFAKRRSQRLLLLLFATLMAMGIVAARSRTVWIAFAVTMPFGLLLLTPRQRLRVLAYGGGSVLVLGIALLALFGDAYNLIVEGLFTRAASISGAQAQDLSLINRFYEWKAALAEIRLSPIVGRGFGTTYQFYDILFQHTMEKSFIHNNYIGLLFRHGIIGLVLFVSIVIYAIIIGLRLFRDSRDHVSSAIILASLLFLMILMINATMEEMLIATDGSFAFMIPLALLSGLHQRSRHGSAASLPAQTDG